MTSVYLAGKVGMNDWRHSVVDGLRGALDAYAPEGIGAAVPEGRFLVLGAVEYTGPFFVGCDHGCAHGPSTHGNGVGTQGAGCIQNGPTRAEVAQRSLAGIAKADHLFAWIDDLTAYGTLVEIGIATGLGKRIWLYTSPHGHYDDLWFARYVASAGVVSTADSPDDAVKDFVSKVTTG